MTIFFSRKETMVLADAADEVRLKLLRNVKSMDKRLPSSEEPDKKNYAFYGIVGKSGFEISKAINVPQNFLPQITGNITPTSKGCIVFLTYRLFYSTRMFLAFWIIICLAVACFFALAYREYFYALAAFLFGVFNYLIALANFKIHVVRSRNELARIINRENPN